MSNGELERELVGRAVSGDQTALSQLLLLHYDDLKRHIAGRIRSELHALMREEDILHQTCIRAALAIERFEWRHEDSFRSWLRTIADHLVKDAEKRRRRERRGADGAWQVGGNGSSAAPFVEGIAGDSTSPSGRVQRRESISNLRLALDSLPSEQREVLQRYYLQSQSLDEIAESMHRSKDAIRGICFRGRRNLRAILGHSSLYFSG